MDDKYKHLTQELKEVESKFRGYVDQPHHSDMVGVANALKRLIQDAGGKKNPHSIEDEVKRLITQLEAACGETDELMDYRHSRDLKMRLEHARDELRKFSNY